MAKTHIGRTIISANEKMQYDEHAKRLLSNKHILARILKRTADEVKDLSISEIMDCIGDDILVGNIPVNAGESNNPIYQLQQKLSDDENAKNRSSEICNGSVKVQAVKNTEAILGDNTESRIPYEGLLTYDIRFHLYVKGKDAQQIKLLINIEAQKDLNKSYDLSTRGIVYCARMISSQIDTEIINGHYEDLKKVYSIWICMNAPDYIGNALTKYSIEKLDLEGITPDKREAYDKLSVLLIYLNEKKDVEGNTLFHLLNVLLSPMRPVTEKETILENRFEIPIDQEYGEELNQMCNLSEAVEEMGIQKGIELGHAQGVEHGETLFATLTERLINDERTDDLLRATKDMDYREKLYSEYGIKR